MNKFIIIIVFTILFRPIFPVLDYVVNYEYISKVLCENKDKPKLKCNGKCHLMKELAKQAESEKPIQNDKKNTVNEFETLFFQEIKTLIVRQIYFQNKTSVADNYANLYFHSVSCSVFHPPALIS